MSEIIIQNDPVNLLWTGGWDSTFQLLQLLITNRRCVKPYYIIDTERKSVGIEIRTIKLIKDQLLKNYPYTKELLYPTQYLEVSDILPDIEISTAFEAILKKTHVGNQYEYLARFCKENGITDMQLSIEKPHSPEEDYWGQQLNKILSDININSETVYRVGEKFKGSDMYLIFQYFSFPIRKITKMEMANITNEQGWNKIMTLTWFCHNPTNNMKPCGICKPCLQIINKGFGWRISFGRRAISIYHQKIFWPLKSTIKIVLSKFGFLEKQIA